MGRARARPIAPRGAGRHHRRIDPRRNWPAEDALLATQNILLAAHAMGLGTCLIGFAVSAMQKDSRIKDLLKIPREENVHAVIALGHPAVTYLRLAGRKKAVSRFVEL